MSEGPERNGGGARGTEEPGTGSPPSVVLSTRQFWALFAAGWVTFSGLLCFSAVMQGEEFSDLIVTVAANLLPLVLPAAFVAHHRRRLLEAGSSLARFIARLVLSGIVYALVVATLGLVIVNFLLTEMPATELGEGPWTIFFVFAVTGLFLYLPFLGFLAWADSLDRVHESRALAAREAVLRAQAEAKALRAQFNPHFVFNTLHSLMLLVRKDPDTAEQAIEDVAALIRYASTLQRREVDQVPLGKELDFARRYVSLEKLRLADRLSVTWAVDDALHDVLVPAFSLQTVIENAIKHGLAPKTEGGTLSVAAELVGPALRLVVSDDGMGADPDAVLGNGGSGLVLLQRRLDTVYGADASLGWRSRPGSGFTATLTIPLRRAPGVEATA